MPERSVMSYGYMFSPLVNITGEFCLDVSIIVNSYTRISSVFKTKDGDSRKHVLFSSDTNNQLKSVDNVLLFDVEVESYELFQLEVMVLGSTESPAVLEIKANKGQCVQPHNNYSKLNQ